MIPGTQSIPLRTIEFGGHRYVAQADFGLDRLVPLMIHGNANSSLMVTHEIAEKISGGPVLKVKDYGYSTKGMGFIDVPVMRLGTQEYTDLKKILVFDWPEEGGKDAQGMLGVAFFVAEKAAIDFSRDVMMLGVEVSAKPDEKLLCEGYKHTQLQVDMHNRVSMQAYFPTIARTIAIAPSTVSNELTLHLPLFENKIALEGKTPSGARSPNRTSSDSCACDRVDFEIAGVSLHAPAVLFDVAAYNNVPEAELPSFGQLGFDWMQKHGAIIDYANLRLYFKP